MSSFHSTIYTHICFLFPLLHFYILSSAYIITYFCSRIVLIIGSAKMLILLIFDQIYHAISCGSTYKSGIISDHVVILTYNHNRNLIPKCNADIWWHVLSLSCARLVFSVFSFSNPLHFLPTFWAGGLIETHLIYSLPWYLMVQTTKSTLSSGVHLPRAWFWHIRRGVYSMICYCHYCYRCLRHNHYRYHEFYINVVIGSKRVLWHKVTDISTMPLTIFIFWNCRLNFCIINVVSEWRADLILQLPHYRGWWTYHGFAMREVSVNPTSLYEAN